MTNELELPIIVEGVEQRRKLDSFEIWVRYGQGYYVI